MKRVAIILGVLAALVAIVLWVRDAFTSDEDRVRMVIDAAAEKIETRAPVGFGDYLAASYLDAWRNDRQRAIRIVAWMRQRFSEIQVNYSVIAVTINGSKATAEFSASVKVRLGEGQWTPLEQVAPELRTKQFQVKLIKENGEWLIRWAGPLNKP